jgi:hypothetical protein
MPQLPWHTASLACCLLALSACGRRDASLAEVRGDVTFCGHPAVAEVLFEPVSNSGQSTGRASTATSDESGRFRLRLDDTQTGAKIGRHRVTIRVQRILVAGDSADGLSGAIKATHLVREVQSGGNEFHFRLTF